MQATSRQYLNLSLEDCRKALEVAEQIVEIIDERIEILEHTRHVKKK